MSRIRRSSVERYHDRVAHRYDAIYDDAYWQWHDALTWDYLKPHLPRNLEDPVIDLGCGTGKWGLKLLQSGYRVTFLDISREMLDQTRQKLEEAHPGTLQRQGDAPNHERNEAVNSSPARAAFLHADLVDLSTIPIGSFALATAFGDPICCTSSLARAMKQIRRILRDGGTLVASFDNRLSAIEHYLEKGDPQALVRFLRDGRTNWLTKDHGERFELHTFTPGEIRKLFEHAGFQVLEMVGKTVLPMRQYRRLLESPDARREWMKIEKSLSRDPDAIGRASHIQVAGKAR